MRPNDKAEVEHSGLKHICYGLLILVLVFGLTGSAIAQGTTTQITNNANNDDYPQIHNGIITWHGSDGSDYEIFMYDIATAATTPITNNANDDYSPQIHNGIITWYGSDGSDNEIFMYSRQPTATAVPALTPIGLIALVGLLSAVAVLSIRKRR